MKVVVHAPFGNLSQETGAVFLLTRYLKKFFGEIGIMRCSGSFSLCDRDAEQQWKRELTTCFSCMAEQRDLAKWSEVGIDGGLYDLSSLVSAQELQESLQWIWQTPYEQLPKAQYKDIQPYPFTQWSFHNRFGVEEPNQSNHHHEQILRRFTLSALRAALAAREYVRRVGPEIALVVGGKDFISAAVASQFRAQGVPTVLFRWDSISRAVKVIHPKSGDEFACGVVLENIVAMRSDPKTWPLELLTIIEELVSFLGLELHQLKLQVGR